MSRSKQCAIKLNNYSLGYVSLARPHRHEARALMLPRLAATGAETDARDPPIHDIPDWLKPFPKAAANCKGPVQFLSVAPSPGETKACKQQVFEATMKFTELYVNGEDRTAEMREIARVIGLDALDGRYSALLHCHLAVSFLSGELNYRKVMTEIYALERGQSTTTKPPAMFNGLPSGRAEAQALLRRWHRLHGQEPDQRHEPKRPAVD